MTHYIFLMHTLQFFDPVVYSNLIHISLRRNVIMKKNFLFISSYLHSIANITRPTDISNLEPFPVTMAPEVKNENNATVWDGNAMSQTDMMEKDTVLVLDNNDVVIGSASKKESHVFSPEQPHGILHRAFSVFIFDESDGSLLLQKRASTKITFPNVRLVNWLVLTLFYSL